MYENAGNNLSGKILAAQWFRILTDRNIKWQILSVSSDNQKWAGKLVIDQTWIINYLQLINRFFITVSVIDGRGYVTSAICVINCFRYLLYLNIREL